MKRQAKMGFLGKFIAHNVNLAEPAVNAKWRTLSSYIKKYESQLSSEYENNDLLQELFKICKEENFPGKLMAFGRNIEGFFNTVSKSIIKKDNILLKIVELYSQAAIASNDKKAIDLAIDIMKQIIEIRNT